MTKRRRLRDALQPRRLTLAKSLRSRDLLAGVLAAAVSIPSLMLATGLAASTAHGGGPCDTYVPQCGSGLCDCGQCDATGGFAATGCDCDAAANCRELRRNPLYRTLDTVAGGVERLLGLDQPTRSACDAGACDTAPWEIVDPASPGPVVHAHPHAAHPRAAHPHRSAVPQRIPHGKPQRLPQVPELPDSDSVPKAATPREVQPDAPAPRPLPAPQRQTQPLQPQAKPGKPSQQNGKPPAQMSPPRIVPSESADAAPAQQAPPQQSPRAGRPESEPKAADRLPDELPRLELPEMAPPELNPAPAEPKPNEGQPNPFDTLPGDDLNDPFSDDAADFGDSYFSPASPTGLRSSAIPKTRPAPGSGPDVRGQRALQPRPTMQSMPTPQPSALPIGSGLRPVSHEEPAGLRPLGGGRARLSPYRPSRR